MRTTKTGTHRERGASLVEFAIVLPIFLVLTGGMVDFGRAFFTEVMLTNAAREGARSAMYSSTSANTSTRAIAAAGGNSALGVSITNPCPASPGPLPSSVTVTVTNPKFEWVLLGPALSLIPGASNSLPTTLSGKATMQCGG
ncbi:TadE/TadG family type IV pilus assembly protein [Flexivirga alba]|uniref:TadE/TadG family type IV pilus assembly protein n=1 Tax=Flexivirga alba TaxID=702742 RepID=A0ABW2AAU3_9MICO